MSLVLDHISTSLGREQHLRDVDLTLAPGSFNVIVGRTLAGKSSLLRVIAGLDRPDTGRVVLDGEDITRTSVQQRPVAMVYQQFVNYPSLTVYENIASPLRLRKAEGIDARVRGLARTLRIEPYLDRLPGQLSGGQQQRVAIARALAKPASLLLLDEPLVNLDYKLREELREELRGILSEREVTVLYATSEPSEAMSLGGQVVLMHEGRAVQQAPTLEVYHRPATPTAARLFSDPPMNLLPARVRAGEAELPGGVRVPLPDHLSELSEREYVIGIRACDCFLDPLDRPSATLRGRVELSEISGAETFVYVRLGAQPGDDGGDGGDGDSRDSSDSGHSLDSFADEPAEATLIVEEEGVHHYELGADIEVHLDAARLIAFAPEHDDDAEPRLVASYQ
ncbi:ABC transporter ATP-binding protein [Haliangium sp.]|uniref:ABC transporter ATP-binding protein n=1 Tax=Haliangium sp. TaxID=2663208 RepID=UPI003D0A40D8